MKEVKITIPDNCELIKDGDNYVVREKMQNPPRSWEEFCEKYPIQIGEAFINNDSCMEHPRRSSDKRLFKLDKNLCTSKKDAEAFLALM